MKKTELPREAVIVRTGVIGVAANVLLSAEKELNYI